MIKNASYWDNMNHIEGFFGFNENQLIGYGEKLILVLNTWKLGTRLQTFHFFLHSNLPAERIFI